MNNHKPQLPTPFVASKGNHVITVTPVRYVTAERLQAYVTVNGQRIAGYVYQTWPQIVREYAAIIATWGN